jgi:hypothetical protein
VRRDGATIITPPNHALQRTRRAELGSLGGIARHRMATRKALAEIAVDPAEGMGVAAIGRSAISVSGVGTL